MEDKVFELLEKMYSEFSEFKKDMNDFRIETKNSIIRIENEHGKKLEALFDGYKQTHENLEVIENKLDDLTEMVKRHDIKIQVIEGGRK